MTSFTAYFPVRIEFGEGRVGAIGSLVKPLGDRALLVADPYWSAAGLTDEVAGRLAESGIETIVTSEFSTNPRCDEIDSLGDLVRAEDCQVIIGLGGGSAIDTAKAVAVMATHEGTIDSYVKWHSKPRQVTTATLPIVAVPTTSGTGAEATVAAVMTDPIGNRKTALVSEYLYPKIAVLDPELTATMSPGLTAATGLDALSHALEGVLCQPMRNYFSDMVAFEAITLVNQYLPRACRDGSDMEARAKMAWASTLGGISITASATTVPHALAQPLGVREGLHHGLAIAAFLPAILEKSWESDVVTFSRLATALGVPEEGLSVGARARSVAGRVRELMEVTGLDAEVAQLTVDQATADAIVEDATGYLKALVDRHVKPFSRDELAEIVNMSVAVVP